ncbi:hypothetical protein DL96DRAFT_1618813, partial [Flagelloscypha sp. PMI_526]
FLTWLIIFLAAKPPTLCSGRQISPDCCSLRLIRHSWPFLGTTKPIYDGSWRPKFERHLSTRCLQFGLFYLIVWPDKILFRPEAV